MLLEHHIPDEIVVAFGVVILLHAAVHLLGVVQGFGWADIESLGDRVSRQAGFGWLAAAVVLGAAGGLYFGGVPWWWAVGGLGVVVSQGSIVLHWSNAWPGTVPNLLVAVVCVVGFGNWQFNRMIGSELAEFRAGHPDATPTIRKDRLDELPSPVADWLEQSGVVGSKRPVEVGFATDGPMRLSRETGWVAADAQHHVRISEPGYIWTVSVIPFPFLHIAVRERLVDGRGESTSKVLSLATMEEADGPKVTRAALVRFLGKMVWYPSAALEDYVTWKRVDDRSATARIALGETSAWGTFEFDEEGRVVGFEAKRYFARDERVTLERWRLEFPAESYETMDGIRVPTEASRIWKLDEDFTSFELEVEQLERHQEHPSSH